MNEGFKIIAIEPLKGCYQKHIKVLSRNTKYYLYNDYKIDKDENISFVSTIPENLYSSDKESPKINVSAIVGKNGSGKSTVIEILLMAINNLSYALSIHNKEIKTVALEPVVGLNVAIYFVSDKKYKLMINRNQISINYAEKDNKQIILNLLYDNKDSKSTKNIDERPNGSYIDPKFELINFFYTIGTNYSQYALNSNDYGAWIENIFHKNDSYQTPLVVNPYRDKGNIDINKENYLIKSRLLAYLLLGETEHLQLTEKQTAQNAVFKLNKDKYKNAFVIEVFKPKYEKTEISFEHFFKVNKKDDILNVIYSVFKITDSNTYYKEQLELYIIRKLISIARTYQKYYHYFDNLNGKFYYDKKNKNNLTNYLKEIFRVDSHVTFKLHQAINFLKNNPFDNLDYKTDKTFSIPFKKLSNEILKNCKKEDIINNIPPPIFNFDIEFEKNLNSENKTDNEVPTFNSLSSGEKQNIYTLYSILYHINNINSVDSSLHKYQNINLVFEEVELYFHPEMQRVWISDLLSQIKKQKFRNIKNINICFITHSPFILSDIPNQNILFLQVDKNTKTSKPIESKTLTFGANIHELLSDSFFLAEGTIGKLASNKMKEIVDFHSRVINQVVSKEIKSEFELKKVNFHKLIDNIGEDVIKGILKNHIDDINIKLYGVKKYNKNKIEELKEEIKRLEANYE